MAMTIFTTMRQTPYVFHQTTAINTWSGLDDTVDFNGWGVWKPRATSDLPTDSPNQTGQPTLNIKVSEKFIDHKNPQRMVGSTVTVPAIGGETYNVVGVTTAKNFRTGRIDHYRLILEERAV